MKISEIITETIDQQAANEVYFALISDGDTETARAFQRIRTNPKYNDVNSALQAAIRLAQKERNKKLSAPVQRTADTPASPQRDTSVKQPAAQSPRGDYSDRFYGNQHTGSLGRKYEPGELGRLMGIRKDSLVGKTIGVAKQVAKPASDLAKAFRIGKDFAPKKL
jgi:hypothetical protein